MPIIFAQSVIVVPGAIAQFSGNRWARRRSPTTFEPDIAGCITSLMAILIIFFTYFYTSIIFNPVDLAENLKKQGGFIPGVKPGSKTAEYIDEVMSRITLPGAVFLTFIALLADVDRRGDQRAVPLWWDVAADRRRCRARHGHQHEPASAAAEIRRVHEEGRPVCDRGGMGSPVGGF